MKTYKQFNQVINENALVKNIVGRTWKGRAARASLFAPEKLGTSKIAKVAQPFYSAATDAFLTGPAAPVVFGASLLSRTYGKPLAKIGKAIEKNRVKHDITVNNALVASPSTKGKTQGDIEMQKNKYMGSIKGVNGSLYPGYNTPKL